MNHKRGRAKNQRSGCLMCKPHKQNGVNHYKEVSKTGFSTIRKIEGFKQDQRVSWQSLV